MNIIITKQTKENLNPFVMNTIEFGSEMKGTSTEESDHDYLHIIRPSLTWMAAPYNTQHLLQYRADNGDDHIFCTPQNFVKCLLDGDSTIFHEIVLYKALTGTCLEWVQDYEFNHYKTLRAYLGIARRDLTEASKLFSKENRKARKKFKFAFEAYNYVASVINEKPLLVPTAEDSHQAFTMQCTQANKHVTDLREQVTIMQRKGEIEQTVSKEDLEVITEKLAIKWYGTATYTDGLRYFRESHVNGN